MCWNWRKEGKCKYGANCKFLHPKNLPKSIAAIDGEIYASDLGAVSMGPDGQYICQPCGEEVIDDISDLQELEAAADGDDGLGPFQTVAPGRQSGFYRQPQQ